MRARTLLSSFAVMSIVVTSSLVAPSAQAQTPQLTYRVVSSFSSIYDKKGSMPLKWKINGTDGIAWDGSGLWITACDTPLFAKLDPTGKLMDEFELPDKEVADHLAWDGEYLWGDVHHKRGTLIQIDTAKRKVLKTIFLPFENVGKMVPMGLGYDGNWLWTSDPGGNAIYRIDPKTGAGKSEPFLPIPKHMGAPLQPCGLISDNNKCLWVGDLGRGGFYQMDATTGKIVSFISPPNNPDPAKYGAFRPKEVKKLFTGMTMSDDGRVWVVDEVEGNPLIYELEVDFPKTGACAQPVGPGEVCSASGEPFCRTNAACWAPKGTAQTTCWTRCNRGKQDCASGAACWTIAGVGDICRPDTSAGYPTDTCKADSDCATAHCLKPSGADVGKCVEPCKDGSMACYAPANAADAGASGAADAGGGGDGGGAQPAPASQSPGAVSGCSANASSATSTMAAVLLALAMLVLVALRRRRCSVARQMRPRVASKRRTPTPLARRLFGAAVARHDNVV